MKTDRYINEFFYFVVRGEGDVLNVCSGVNMDKFYPLLKGRYGIGGNPVTSGLNIINRDFCTLARARGSIGSSATAVKLIYPMQEGDDGSVNSGADCAGIAPARERWYGERIQIKTTSALSGEEIIATGVMRLIGKVVSCTNLQYPLPGTLPTPEEAQAYLEGLLKAMEARAA